MTRCLCGFEGTSDAVKLHVFGLWKVNDTLAHQVGGFTAGQHVKLSRPAAKAVFMLIEKEKEQPNPVWRMRSPGGKIRTAYAADLELVPMVHDHATGEDRPATPEEAAQLAAWRFTA